MYNAQQKTMKKKPPPRPPPPNFSKYKSKSTYNLHQNFESLIDWSPPSSPQTNRNHPFGGSISSSFSSSTSSLGSSKKSFEFDLPNNWAIPQNAFSNQNSNSKSTTSQPVPLFGPTIIRPQVPKKNVKSKEEPKSYSPPMPSIPPPSPPKEATSITTPYGVALYDFPASHSTDLPLQVGDVVILLRKVNSEWYYGKVLDKEGMFPANFIDVQVPLPEKEDNIVTALFAFEPQVSGDLKLVPGQMIKVTKIINNEWLFGESNGQSGQFPSNFVNRIPKLF